jgi:hypothetical protein
MSKSNELKKEALGFHVRCTLPLFDFNKSWMCRETAVKLTKIKLHEIRSAVLHTSGGTDITDEDNTGNFQFFSTALKSKSGVTTGDVCEI